MTYKEHIEYSFNAFCKTVLYYEAINAYREISKKREREVSLDYLYEVGCEPSAAEHYLTTFNIRGEAITIANEQLATALLNLTEQQQEILFLYFFFGYRDAEIGKLCGCCRTTANYRKNTALRQLRKEMEVLRIGE
ncbi:RNA polymerase sigma factor [Bacteroides congonensis]